MQYTIVRLHDASSLFSGRTGVRSIQNHSHYYPTAADDNFVSLSFPAARVCFMINAEHFGTWISYIVHVFSNERRCVLVRWALKVHGGQRITRSIRMYGTALYYGLRILRQKNVALSSKTRLRSIENKNVRSRHFHLRAMWKRKTRVNKIVEHR